MFEGCPCCKHVTPPRHLKSFGKISPVVHKRGFYKSSGMHKMRSTSKPTTLRMVCVKMYSTLYLQHFSPVFDRSCRFCIQYTAIVISSHLRLIRGKTSDMMDALQKQSKMLVSIKHFLPALTVSQSQRQDFLFIHTVRLNINILPNQKQWCACMSATLFPPATICV